MTALITFINTGFDAGFFNRWAHSFVIAWPVAFIIIFFLRGSVQKMASRLCNK